MAKIPTTEERLGRSPQRIVRYFALLMGVVYVGLGVAMWVLADRALNGILQLSPTSRRVLGTVFIIYGTVRLVRVFQANRRKPSDHD